MMGSIKEYNWQIITSVICFMSYIFIYFCRNHLYVVESDFKAFLDPVSEQNAQKILGLMITFGYIAGFFGKILFSLITDTYFKSGVTSLLIAMIFGPFVTLLFTLINIETLRNPVLTVTILFCLLKISQSGGWIGIVRIISNWIPAQYHGRVMAFISLSFLLGDFITRICFGLVIENISSKWQHVFVFAALTNGLFTIPTAILLRDDPTQRGLSPTKNSKKHLLNTNSDHSKWRLVKSLLNNFNFWILLIFEFEFRIIRELFNIYSAMYLHENIGASESVSAWISSIFPLMGVVSAPLCGWYVDVVKVKHWRLVIIPIAAVIIFICLLIFSLFDGDLSIYTATILLLISGFTILGPYTLFAGVMSIDLGGQQSSALVSGLVEAVGYCGGILISLISSFFGFKVMFGVAAFVAFSAIVTGIIQFIVNLRRSNTILKSQMSNAMSRTL